MNNTDEQYQAERAKTEARFTPDRAGTSGEPKASPSGRYRLVVTPYDQGKPYWGYTQGDIYRGNELVFSVQRNHDSFPFAWIEDHPDGHDYMVTGEDYQGYTILQLDTGDRWDHFPEGGHKGHGWCFVVQHPSPDRTMLAVEGCYWACPYETRIYDFSQPLGPLSLIADLDSPDFLGWIDEVSCKIGMCSDWCIPLGKWEHELTPEEQDKYIMNLPDDEYDAVWEDGKEMRSVIWTRP